MRLPRLFALADQSAFGRVEVLDDQIYCFPPALCHEEVYRAAHLIPHIQERLLTERPKRREAIKLLTEAGWSRYASTWIVDSTYMYERDAILAPVDELP